MRRAALLVTLAVAGCITPSPPAEPDLARPAAPSPPAAAKPAAPPLPALAEVELGGEVTRPPKSGKGDATVWIVDAPCWQPGARAFNTTKTTGDKFFVEVMVPQGTNLWVCAALGDPGKPLDVYGQATRAPLLGKGAGEVPFMGLVVPLAKGNKVAPPAKR
ncbi:MAG TPA: hypothetical protein VF997_24905 [Polyangia bacterium]